MFRSKLAKFKGKIGIDLTMIFRMYDFFFVRFLVFEKKVNFVNDFVHNFQVLSVICGSKMMFISKDAQFSDRSFCTIEFFFCAILSL